MNFHSHNKSHKGFTLIEVLIAMMILAFISLGIFQAIRQSYHIRDVLLAESEFYHSVRLAMNVMDKDISLLYSPKIILKKDTNSNSTAQPIPEPGLPPSGDPNANPNNTAATGPTLADAIAHGERYRGTEYWTSVVDPTGIRLSRFIGKENSMNFITASHVRMYKGIKESVFAKVSYSVENNPDTNPEIAGKLMLLKTVSTNAFNYEEDNDPSLKKYKILSGIKSIHFKYYQLQKDVWHKSWDTDSADYKDIYPDLIQVVIEATGEQRLSFEGNYIFKPEIPYYGLPATL